MPIWSLTLERLEKLERAIKAKKAEHDELQAKTEKDLWCADLDEFLVEWDAQEALDAKIKTNIRRMGRRVSKKIGAGKTRKPKAEDDYEPEKKSRGKKAAPKVETKSSQRFADMFSAKPKLKQEATDDDAFDDDDDFSALSRSKPAAKPAPKTSAAQSRSLTTSARPSAEPEPAPVKRVAAVSARKFMDLSSDSDNDDDMLGDIGDLVKGVPKDSAEPSGRFGLHGMSSTSSDAASKAAPPQFDGADEEEDVKPALDGPTIDSFLSDDDEDVKPKKKTAASKSSAAAAVAGLSDVKKSRGRPAAGKAKGKEPAKAKAEPQQTTLSPAAKAYAAKKASKKPTLDDSDEDEMADSPPPKPAARGRPGRAAAARRPIVLDESSLMDDSDPFEVDDDDD